MNIHEIVLNCIFPDLVFILVNFISDTAEDEHNMEIKICKCSVSV